MKIAEKREPWKGGLENADGFLRRVIELHGDKPFIPKGVHRFKTFEESQEWTLKMLTRRRSPEQPT